MKFSFKPQWHQILISLLIGLSIGVTLDKQCENKHFKKSWKETDMRDRMMQKLTKELKLDAAQQTKVRAVFDANHPRMVALHDEMRPKFEAIKNDAQTEIRKALTPEQIVLFDKLNKKMEERRKNRPPFSPGI